MSRKAKKVAGLIRYAITRTVVDFFAWFRQRPFADAFLTVRARDGAVIDAFNAETPVKIASLTKIMSACVCRDVLKDNRAEISLHQGDFVSSSPSFKMGDTVSVEALMSAMMLYSDNVAAEAISRYSGPDFVPRMNAYGLGKYTDAWGSGEASAHDVINIMRNLELDDGLLRVVKTQYFETQLNGSERRKVSWNNRVIGRSKIPGFIWGKTGTSDYRASLAFSWCFRGEFYYSAILRSRGDRFKDGNILVSRVAARI